MSPGGSCVVMVTGGQRCYCWASIKKNTQLYPSMMPTLKYCTMYSLANFRPSNNEILDKITRKSNKRNAVMAERLEHGRDEQKGQYGSLIWEIKPQIPDLIRMGSPSQPWSRFLGSPIHNTACSLLYTHYGHLWLRNILTKWVCHFLVFTFCVSK